jgi:hypothetical protein
MADERWAMGKDEQAIRAAIHPQVVLACLFVHRPSFIVDSLGEAG